MKTHRMGNANGPMAGARARFAHISDLHIGKDAAHTRAATQVATRLRGLPALSRIVVTGDVTQSGRAVEGRAFERIFEGLWDRMTVVPGNHDRATDDYAKRICGAERVWVQMLPRSRFYFICVDSTSPWNASLPFANGMLTPRDVADVASAARLAPPDFLVSVLLHHHVLPAAIGDSPLEVLSDAFRLPFLQEVDGGRDMLRALPPNVRLVLHGHKHVPSERHIASGLSIFNGGSTTELGAFRVFSCDAANRAVSSEWVNL